MTLEQLVTVASIFSGVMAILLNYRKSSQESQSQNHKELMDIIDTLRKENERLKQEHLDAETDCSEWRTKYEKLVETIRELHLDRIDAKK